MQLHEVPACVSHVVHLQVGSDSQHSGDNARGQREAGGVHEVEQHGDAGWIQRVGERDCRELLTTATVALK